MGVTRREGDVSLGRSFSKQEAERWGRFFALLMTIGDEEAQIAALPYLRRELKAVAGGNRGVSDGALDETIGRIVIALRQARGRWLSRRTGKQWAGWAVKRSRTVPHEFVAMAERLGSRRLFNNCAHCRKVFFVEDTLHENCSDRCADRRYRKRNSEKVRAQTRERVRRFRRDRGRKTSATGEPHHDPTQTNVTPRRK